MSDREKSALYPAYTLEECIDFVKTIESFKSKTVSYRAVASKYGLTSVTTKSFTQKIGSSKQYGLITTSSSTIQLTELAMRILYPTSTDIQSYKIECFCLPPLYKALIEEFNNKAIPTENILANLLMSKHKISRVAKNMAAQIFIKNAEELGFIQAGVFSLVSQNDVITDDKSIIGNSEMVLEEDEIATGKKDNKRVVELNDASEYITQTYPVESGKVAKIIIPIDSTEDDLYAIRDLLEVVMKRKFKINLE